jgi:hypothetical protein
MGIDLRGKNATVTQEALNEANVGSGLQQHRGRRVAQHVRRHAPYDSSPLRNSCDRVPDARGGERSPMLVNQ